MSEVTRRELEVLIHRASSTAKAAHFEGLDPRTAILGAAIYVAFPESMTRRDIAQWLRRFANEYET